MNLIHSEGFTKRNRIRKNIDFNKLFKTGSKSRLEFVNVITTENNLGYARLGIAISKKFIPKSVDRNKLKRTFRELFRKNRYLIGSKDILIICKQLNRESIKHYKAKDVENLFKKKSD